MSLWQQGALQDFHAAHTLYFRNKQVDGVTGWADATNMILFELLHTGLFSTTTAKSAFRSQQGLNLFEWGFQTSRMSPSNECFIQSTAELWSQCFTSHFPGISMCAYCLWLQALSQCWRKHNNCLILFLPQMNEGLAHVSLERFEFVVNLIFWLIFIELHFLDLSFVRSVLVCYRKLLLSFLSWGSGHEVIVLYALWTKRNA